MVLSGLRSMFVFAGINYIFDMIIPHPFIMWNKLAPVSNGRLKPRLFLIWNILVNIFSDAVK